MLIPPDVSVIPLLFPCYARNAANSRRENAIFNGIWGGGEAKRREERRREREREREKEGILFSKGTKTPGIRPQSRRAAISLFLQCLRSQPASQPTPTPLPSPAAIRQPGVRVTLLSLHLPENGSSQM